MSKDLREEDLQLCDKCANLYESDKAAYESGEKILDLCDDCFDKYKEVFDEEETDEVDLNDPEIIISLQEVEKENRRMEYLYSDLEFECTESNEKARQEAESLGVFFRTLIKTGLSTTEAYNIMIQKMTCDNNLEVTKLNQVNNMCNQI